MQTPSASTPAHAREGDTPPGEQPAATTRDTLDFLAFRLDELRFAAAIRYVREVHRHVSVTRVPNLPAGIAGVTNLRSRIVPVVDLKRALLSTPGPMPPRSRLVVCEVGETVLALHVDGTHEVVTVHRDHILEVPPGLGAAAAHCVRSVFRRGDDLVGILDLPAFIATVLADGARP